MKIYDVRGIGANLTGSFSGSFGGVFAGTLDNVTVTASYVDYTNVVNKPTLVSSSAQIGEYGVFATTGSNQFDGSQAITGSLTVTGEVVAQTLNVQQVTSSIVYSSGSNVFGNDLGNTQQFTGSLQVSGSSHYLLGDLGIGTASPAVKLDVAGEIRSTSTSGYAALLSISALGYSILADTHTGGAMTIWTAGSEKMRITSGGNVLIGTTTDSGYKLDVNGTGRFSGTLTGASSIFTNIVVNASGVGVSVIGLAGNPAYFVTDQSVNNSGKRWRFGYTGAIGGFGSFDFYNQTDNITALTLASTGEATFSSNVTAVNIIARRDSTTSGTDAQFISENRTGTSGQYAIY